MQSAGKTSSIESKVQITNTEILATPTVNPPAHLMEDARRVRDETELHDSRESTPQGKSIPGLSAGVLNKPLLSEPHLQPSDIPLYSRRSPRIAGLNAAAVTDAPIETQSSPIAIEPELKTPAKIAPVGPKCAPKGQQRRKAASLPMMTLTLTLTSSWATRCAPTLSSSACCSPRPRRASSRRAARRRPWRRCGTT